MHKTMTVVQCWDDGVSTDVPLMEILRSHGAKATFNLCAGLHTAERQAGRKYKGAEFQRLGWTEMKAVYEGFTIANHSLTHPHLEQIAIATARAEIAEGRERLQQFFQQPVRGFAYPFGTYSAEVMTAVHEAGHAYARTVRNVERPFPPEHPMAFHPSCHFLAPDFWERYVRGKASGVFYFWGHSYEIISETMWADFAGMIERISDDPESRWADVQDLYPPPMPQPDALES